jgi:Mrp family chromosome partitioning ATPase
MHPSRRDSDGADTDDGALVRTKRMERLITINPLKGTHVDATTVAFPYYNSFNYSLVEKDNAEIRLTVGITSPNPGEGKTLVASNFAVSLAMAYRKKTVLVDLNVQRPRLHEVFGTALNPGLVEALGDGSISVSSTQIEKLHVLAAGTLPVRQDSSVIPVFRASQEPVIGLEHLEDFLDVVHTLEQAYQFVLVDMPSINTRDFPILFASQLNGLIVVVDATKTRQQDIEAMFRHVSERQVLGFVLNRMPGPSP